MKAELKHDCSGYRIRLEADLQNAEERRFLFKLANNELQIVAAENSEYAFSPKERRAVEIILGPRQI